MHCNTISAILAIARLADVDGEVSGVEWFSLDYERFRFIFSSQVPGVTRERAYWPTFTEIGKGKIRSFYCEELTKVEWHLFYNKGDDYTEYRKSEIQDHVARYRIGLLFLEDCQSNISLDADPDVYNLAERVDDDVDWDFNGAVGRRSAQLIGAKWWLLDLQNKCGTKIHRVPTSLDEVAELAQDLLWMADALVNSVSSSEVLVPTIGNTTELVVECG